MAYLIFDTNTNTYIKKPKIKHKKTKKFTGNRLHCLDKNICHHSVYLTDIFVLDLHCYYVKNKAELKSWTLKGPNCLYRGNTLVEFRQKLYELIRNYNLKVYPAKCFEKDQVLIYTNNILKARGILQDEFNITDEFKEFKFDNLKSFTILDFFIIQEPEGWTDANDILDMYDNMQNIMNDIFITEERVYLSPYQRNRKRVKKLKMEDIIMPEKYSEYEYWKNSYYGGAAFSKRNVVYNEPIIEYDRKSAYLYEFFMPHMSGPLKPVDISEWKRWIDNMEINNSIGTYRITFEMEHRMLNVFNRSKKPWQFNKQYTVNLALLNTDLKLFLKCAKIINIECLTLFEYETRLLPKEFLEYIIDCFLDKETKGGIYKTIANAMYGSMCMDLSFKKYNELKANPSYCPMWGYEIAAYARKHLFECGSKLENWVYSDTDSIFCKLTSENETIINEYNMFMQKVLKNACEYYDLDFNVISKLGLYKFETEIKKMCIRGVKTYAYIDVEGNFVQKASGMCKDAKNTWEDWISGEKLDYGTKINKVVTDDGYFEVTDDSNIDLNTKSAELVSVVKINNKYNNFDIHWNTSKPNVNKNIVF